MTGNQKLDWLCADDITPAIRRQRGRDIDALISWSAHPLLGGGGEGLGVWRVRGTALIDHTVEEWSLVLKGWKAPERDIDPAAFDDPHREVSLYRSGMLNDIPDGIHAPRYLGDLERADGSFWVWLEDLATVPQPLWNTERYMMVARQLGRFSGSWIANRPLPDHPNLSRNWLRQWVEASGPPKEAIARTSGDALVQQSYPPRAVDAYNRLWEERESHFAVLDALPRTFAHLDVFPRNMFFRPRAGGDDEIVLVDWSFAGIAGLGEELVPLVPASAVLMQIPISEARHLLGGVLDLYIEGLRDTGWDGDADLVRSGYERAVVLRYGLGAVRTVLLTLTGAIPPEVVEQNFGRSFDEVIENGSAFGDWMCELVEGM